MALGTFIAGRFTGTYNLASLGILEEGWRLSWAWHKEIINNTDAYGDTPIDAVYRGASVWISGIFKEVLAGTTTAVAPYNSYAPSGASAFAIGTIGVLDSATAKSLVLTSTAGTPAVATPATLTATLAVMDNEFTTEQLWGPNHRKTPFRFMLYPYVSATTIFFSTT